MVVTPDSLTSKKAWARVCAFAWMRKNEEVLKDLRRDPKGTIEELAKGENGKYKADTETAKQAGIIGEISKKPSAKYEGYLPIPKAVGGLEKLTQSQLQELLENGITGGFKFNEEAQLWAEVLFKAWQDEDLLENIRRDPLNYLFDSTEPQKLQKLQNSQYGIFPVPDLPSVVAQNLEKLNPDQLYEFLIDDNVHHIGGIMPPVT